MGDNMNTVQYYYWLYEQWENGKITEKQFIEKYAKVKGDK